MAGFELITTLQGLQVGCKIKQGGFGASPAAGSWCAAVAVGHFISWGGAGLGYSQLSASSGMRQPLLIPGDPAQEPAGDLCYLQGLQPKACAHGKGQLRRASG